MNDITKQAIVSSFKKLASQNNISDITIKDIMDDCGLKRQTFYNHFVDKYDLIKWIYLNEVIQKLEKTNSWIDKYRCIFEYFLNNKNVILNIYNCEAQNYLIHFINRQSIPIIKSVIDEKSNGLNISDKDKKFLCFFYSGALGSLIINWLELGMPDNIEDIITRVEIVLNGNINNYFNMTKDNKCQK